MLPKENRLKNDKAFFATYNVRDVVSNEYVVLYRGKKKTDDTIPTKIGFVVSKKYHKRATKRNRAKRLYRESLRLLLKTEKAQFINKYLSMVFVIKSNSQNIDFQTCYSSVMKLLEKK